MNDQNNKELKEKVVQALKMVYDPEIPVDVYELGLIYEINIFPINNVFILMTLTSPACPAGGSLSWVTCEIGLRMLERRLPFRNMAPAIPGMAPDRPIVDPAVTIAVFGSSTALWLIKIVWMRVSR